ncbi:MAG TPA: AAA family ATPase [Planctomycetota bacterium]|nr:AAA family ATPase [Planctomycetota bacterium]
MAKSKDETQEKVAEHVEKFKEGKNKIMHEFRKAIVGQDVVVGELLMAFFAGGHLLITGVPGLAKTLMIRTMGQILDLSFRRIQFTPDLMPSDITGTEILEEDRSSHRRAMKFIEGPLFANIVLADEINRASPKTQAALLEAMQEQQVTVSGKTYPLERPFFVLATQNPIEQEGTYPLPKLEQDRFMFSSIIDHLPRDEEIEVVNMTTSTYVPDVKTIMAGEELLRYQEIVRETPVSEPVIRYAVRLAASSRPGANGEPLDFVKEYVSWGASIRGSHYLVLAAKARAILDGRFNVGFEDIQAVAMPVLRHRITTNFRAESAGLKPEDIIEKLIEAIPPPHADL